MDQTKCPVQLFLKVTKCHNHLKKVREYNSQNFVIKTTKTQKIN